MSILPDWLIEQHVTIDPKPEPAVKRPGRISYGLSSYGYDARVGYKFGVFSPVGCQVVDPKAFDPKMLVEYDLTPEPHQWEKAVSPSGRDMFSCSKCRRWTHHPTSEYEQRYACGNKPDHILIPPNSFALAETLEHFVIPRDVLAVCVGKSTYARCGIIINVTPLEPEWKGKVTVEISNTGPLPAKIYAGEGIMQILFFRTDGVNEAMLNAVRRLCGQQAQSTQNHQPAALRRIEEQLHAELGLATCRKSYKDKDGKYQDQDSLTLPKVD